MNSSIYTKNEYKNRSSLNFNHLICVVSREKHGLEGIFDKRVLFMKLEDLITMIFTLFLYSFMFTFFLYAIVLHVKTEKIGFNQC